MTSLAVIRMTAKVTTSGSYQGQERHAQRHDPLTHLQRWG